MSTPDRPVTLFWTNVLAILRERRVSLKSLAADVSVTPAAFSRYSRGAVPSIEVAARIAQTLDVSLDELVRHPSGELVAARCMAPEEHAQLAAIKREFGLDSIAELAPIEAQRTAWAILDLLAEHYPEALSCEFIRAQFPDTDGPAVEASFVALSRRGFTREIEGRGGRRIELTVPSAQVSARELPDVSLHLKRAARMLFKQVLPALERQDDSGHLITFHARIPRVTAENLIRALTTEVKHQAKESLNPEPGDTDVNLLFAVAHRPSAD